MRAVLAFGAPGALRAVPRPASRRHIPTPIDTRKRVQRPALRRAVTQAYGGQHTDTAVEVTFVLQREVCYGQNVLLTGDCEELGAWDLSRSTRMEWSEGRNGEHHWSATITLPRGANVEYKFVIDDPRHPALWESCWNRKLTVSPSTTELYGYWNQPLEEDAEATAALEAAYTSPSSTSSTAYGGEASNGASNGKVNGWSDTRGRSPAARPAASSNGATTTGLSPEQRAFLERKAAEVRGSSSAPAHRSNGASAPPPRSLSPEQQAFLERKRREASGSPAARGRSQPSAPVRASSSSAPAQASVARSLSPEQKAFLERRERERSGSAAPRAASGRGAASSAGAAPAVGLTPDQQAFLERKRQQE